MQISKHIRWIAPAFVAALFLQSFMPHFADASQITNRSLTLEAGTTDGGSKPGGTVKHLFQFTIPSTSPIGSIKLQYCTLAATTCVTPTGINTSSATLLSQSGIAGFSIDNTTNGTPILFRGTTINPSANTAVTYELGSIVNPTTTNTTFFVRLTTYASLDGSGPSTDAGVVAASTATPINLDGIMPESLVFCTGATVGLTGGVPDCNTATSGDISFNQLFSPVDTATATSQMAASTNAGFGYNITVNGPTLTSGANTVSGMSSSTTGIHGVSQFGLNLATNTTATSTIAVGSDIAPVSNGTNYRAEATGPYAAPDNFKFTTGDSVADSASGGAGGTDAQIYTVSYIANVPGSQPAGTYSTTLTYICTPTF